MRLYYHTDRQCGLKPGQIIECEPYHDESLLSVFAPFMDADFLSHLRAMQREGLSLHGVRYLMSLRDSVNYPSFAIEIYYEFVRWKHYPGKPSRLQSAFAFLRYEDALLMAQENGRGRIYEVRCDKATFVGDLAALKLSLSEAGQAVYAHRYWSGEPLQPDVEYKPRWECILNLPVEVVREMLVNPVDLTPVYD